MNFIKFDGIEAVDDQTYLIDAKRNVLYWNKEGMRNIGNTLRRINIAKEQNPEIKIIYEFPDEKAKGYFEGWIIEKDEYRDTIDEIRIRK